MCVRHANQTPKTYEQDYLDAFEKLSRLSLPAKQDREVIRVLVECFLQSRAYNPYFAVLATQLCKHDHNHKFTLQYVYIRFHSGLLHSRRHLRYSEVYSHDCASAKVHTVGPV